MTDKMSIYMPAAFKGFNMEKYQKKIFMEKEGKLIKFPKEIGNFEEI